MVVGDWAWGVGAMWPHPVLRVNRESVTVGIHRDAGFWLTTQTLRWADLRGVIPAEVDHHRDTSTLVGVAADRVRRGYLSDTQRDALAGLLPVASTAILPTPVTAVLHHTLTALTHAAEPSGS